MEEYNFKKSSCERYDIRLTNHYGGWAIITIDENGGLFNAHTDYGNYNYSWPNHGRESFKHFILELVKDKHYFMNKIASCDYYCAEETEEAWKKQIIEDRRDRELSKKEARELWNEIIEFDYHTSCHNIQRECYENETVCKYYCEPWYAFDTVMKYHPQTQAFVDLIMPIFGEIIQREIAVNV